MEQIRVISMTIFMFHFVLLVWGNKSASMNRGDDADLSLSNRQAIKTIQTEDGDVFDCIDINHQPAFNHPLLRNHKIQMKPESSPSGVHFNYLPDAINSGAQLSIIACPTGTIPILRNVGVDQMKSSHFGIMDSETDWKLVGIKTSSYDIYGTRVSINVYEPQVKGRKGDFSASWTTMVNGQDNRVEGIGAGSIVWPSFRGDNHARFHITWVGNIHQDRPCYDHLCPGFMQTNKNIGLGGKIQPVSTYGGPQYKIDVYLYKDKKTGNWWLAYGEFNTLIGYWPSSLFTSMKDKAAEVFWGGYVDGPTIKLHPPQMGSGHFAEEGFGKAAFVRDIQVVNGNNNLVPPDSHKSFAGSSRKKCYTVADYGQNDKGMHVYFGGPGNCN